MRRLRTILQRSTIALMTLALAFPMSAQKATAFEMFVSDSIRNVQLKTNMKTLVKGKYKEEYQPAKISIEMDDGEMQSWDIRIKSRGNRRKEVCFYPPIFVNFPKEVADHHKVKWVLPCRDSEAYDYILLKEYLCYQMFELFTDNAFRTALLRLEFINEAKDDKASVRYAFAIEPIDQVAKRIGGRPYKPRVMQTNILNEEQEALFNMFQFMIGNTDWAIANSHNINGIADTVTSTILLLPYDYDYAGIVGTAYAVPHESIPIDEVTERYNKGFCISEGLAEKYRLQFLAKKDEIMAMIEEFPYFQKNQAELMVRYIKPFFEIMESPERTKKAFCENCKIAGSE